MIFEQRTYRLKVGATTAYLEYVASVGIHLQKKHLKNLVGYFTSEIGPLNQIVHIWAYESLEDRDRKRSSLASDPDWVAFAPKIQVLIETMECVILKPTSFSPEWSSSG